MSKWVYAVNDFKEGISSATKVPLARGWPIVWRFNSDLSCLVVTSDHAPAQEHIFSYAVKLILSTYGVIRSLYGKL
jgi:hypothetical protein